MREMKVSGERLNQYLLDAGERPRVMYEFYVTGGGEFPADMLRYDKCWPATGDDAAKMFQSYFGGERPKHRSIRFWSYREPTIDRWSSFNWTVGEKAVVS